MLNCLTIKHINLFREKFHKAGFFYQEKHVSTGTTNFLTSCFLPVETSTGTTKKQVIRKLVMPVQTSFS